MVAGMGIRFPFSGYGNGLIARWLEQGGDPFTLGRI
jgi:hypothetical protein